MINNNLTKNIRMKKMICFSKGVAVLALGLVVASCSKMDDVYRQLSEEEAVAHAEEVLDMEIDPNKDWNMTRNGSMTITANAGINTTEVLILDAYPFGNADAKILGQAKANEGETVTIDYIAPKGQEYVYVACRNANNDYRVVYSAIDAGEVSFKQQAPRRAPVESPSVTEVGNTFNSQICQSWNGVMAAEATGTDGPTYINFMGVYAPWKPSQTNTAWTDKFYQINATVADSNRPDQELSDIAETIMRVIPEGKNNLDKANETGYSIVTTGGEVTLTPIFHNSNSGDQISYYYYPQGTTPDVKSLKKYVVGNMADPETTNTNNYSFNKKVYNLVFEDANGNVSYDFPEGYVINFIITNTWVGNGTVEVYESGGEVTSSPGELTSQGKFTIDQGKAYSCGEDAYLNGYFQMKFGKGVNAPFAKPVQGSSIQTQNNTFNYYTAGNGVNGSMAGGATAYYIKPWNTGKLRLVVALRENCPFYVKDLGIDNWNAADGNAVTGYNGLTKSSDYYGYFDIDVESNHVYAFYAENSSLRFYGYEFFGMDNGNYYYWGADVLSGNDSEFPLGTYRGSNQAGLNFGKYTKFAAAASDSNVSGYTTSTSGTGINGSLNNDGATAYYFMPYNSGYLRVAVSLNANKPFYIKDLGNNGWGATSGQSLEGYDGLTKSEKYYGTFDFPVEGNHVYAVYAAGSKLGFYGCEYLTSSGSSTTITDIVKTSIPNNPEYYGDGAYNTAIHTSGLTQWNLDASLAATPHAAVFSIGGKNYVGFEDWKDLDFNDVIFEITGTEGGEEIPVEELGKPIYSYAFEDTNGGDYDMNDVVIRARESADGTKMILKFVAAGATLDLNVRLYPNAGADGMTYGETFKVLDRNGKTEIHEMFNADHGYMINTNGGDANCASATPFEIEIDKATYGITDASKLRLAIYAPQHNVEMRLSGAGTMPYGLIVPGNWKWPQEYINIKRAYSNKNTNEAEADQSFENYGSRHDDNQEHAVWWFMYPTDNLVMDESDLPQ